MKCGPDSVMKIASISKPITIVLMAKEWEKGTLDLDADVRQYVPYWPDKCWDGEKVPFELCFATVKSLWGKILTKSIWFL